MIPKVIHYCWFGKGKKNSRIEECIESWKKHCPDYQIVEWNESNYDVNGHPFMKAAYEAKKWAFVSDYARIDILFRHGGIYMDTDVELLQSLDDFLEYGFYAGFESNDYVALGLGFGSVAGHVVLKEILEVYDTITFSDKTLDQSTMSCPIIQTNVLKKHGLVCNNRNQVFEDCHIYSTEYFCPMSYSTGKLSVTDKTVSIHHYDMSWVPEHNKKARKREWKLKEMFGEKWGKRLSMMIGFPGKLANNAREGMLFEYLRFLVTKKR